jgi:hypothetical protein
MENAQAMRNMLSSAQHATGQQDLRARVRATDRLGHAVPRGGERAGEIQNAKCLKESAFGESWQVKKELVGDKLFVHHNRQR